jgi:uncharacterized protein YkwD
MQAVDGWIKSDGHRKNMEGQFLILTGTGLRNAKGEYYFTQLLSVVDSLKEKKALHGF